MAEIAPVRATITADATQFNRAAEQAKDGLRGIGGAYNTLGAQLDQVQGRLQRLYALYANDPTAASAARIAALASAYRRQESELKRATGALGGFASGGNAANQTLVDLGRFTNDATQFQYGFRQGLVAVANQIDGLVLGFKRMGQQAAASGTSIRGQLLSSLKGSGGLLIVLNLAATAAVVFGDKIVEAFNDGAKAAEEAKGAFTDAIKEIIKFDGAGEQVALSSAQQSFRLATGAAETIRALREQATAMEAIRDRSSGASQGTLAGGGVTRLFTEEDRAQLANLNRQIGDYTDILNEANTATRRFNALARGSRLLGDLGAEVTTEDSRQADRESERAAQREANRLAREAAREAARLERERARDAARAAAEVAKVRADLEAAISLSRELVSVGLLAPQEQTLRDIAAVRQAIEATLSLPGVGAADSRVRALVTQLRSLQSLESFEGLAARVRAPGVVEYSEAIREAATETTRARIEALRLDSVLQDVAAVPTLAPKYEKEADAIRRQRQEAERLAQTLSSAAAEAALTIGAEAFRRGPSRLDEIEAERQREALQEQFREGQIGAEEFQLRVEELDDSLAELRGGLPGLGRGFRDAFAQIAQSFVIATTKALAFAAVIAALRAAGINVPGTTPSFGSNFIGSLFGGGRANLTTGPNLSGVSAVRAASVTSTGDIVIPGGDTLRAQARAQQARLADGVGTLRA